MKTILFFLSLLAGAIASAQGYVSHRVLVGLSQGTDIERGAALVSSVGGRIDRQIKGIAVEVVSLPSTANETAILAVLKGKPGVKFAELDRLVAPAQIVPNDPLYGSEWHLPKISCPNAWTLTTGSPSVIVAMIDTGVNATHPDLMANLIPGWNVYDNNGDTSDHFGHGTTTAGTVAASGNNGIGVASVAWNCRIMPVRICSSTSTYASYSVIASGFTWAANHGATVANCSYDCGSSYTVGEGASYLQSKGGVATIAAGNSGANLTYSPNPFFLLVGASNSLDVRDSYSNYGTPLSLVAPGEVTTTLLSGGYGGASGTSYSAPLVAGVAALMKSVSPNLSGPQVMSLIEGSCDDLGSAGWDIYYGWGRLNAAKAVFAASVAPIDTVAPIVSIASPANGTVVNRNSFVVTVNASDNVGVVKVELWVDGNLNLTYTSPPWSLTVNSRPWTKGNHTLVCKAYDAARNVGISASVTVRK